MLSVWHIYVSIDDTADDINENDGEHEEKRLAEKQNQYEHGGNENAERMFFDKAVFFK